MTLSRITLRLARNPEAGFPEGDDARGYSIVAPLDGAGAIDAEGWRAHKSACTVRRFSPDEAEIADGWLTRRGANWHFHYDEADDGPDEPLHRLGEHRMAVGEYITVKEKDGDALVYRVADVHPLGAGGR